MIRSRGCRKLRRAPIKSFGCLSYRNAKFALIDCHRAFCAYARHILLETARIAESRGFEAVHGIVDSLWIKKQGATQKDFEELCSEVRYRIARPVTFEGVYRWIDFLPSRMHEDVPVLANNSPALSLFYQGGSISDWMPIV
jgi:hypothetical protein